MPDIVTSGALATIERDQIEDFCRREARAVVLSADLALVRTLGKYILAVDPQNLDVSPHLMMNGFWQTWLTQAVARHVKPGMRVFELPPTHYGYFTMLMCDLVGPKGEVQIGGWVDRADHLGPRTLKLNGFAGRGRLVAEPALPVNFIKLTNQLAAYPMLVERVCDTMMATMTGEHASRLAAHAAELGYRVRYVDYAGKLAEKAPDGEPEPTLWIDHR